MGSGDVTMPTVASVCPALRLFALFGWVSKEAWLAIILWVSLAIWLA
jgi:hypothetical protein